MSNTLTKTEITRLPKLVSALQGSQLAVEYWKAMHAEAGSLKEAAWRAYSDAVDLQFPRGLIGELLANAILFDAICRDTWEEWETAKKNLLALSN